MQRVKICGITNYEDAIHAVHEGADALGFIFYEASPRYIDPTAAATIIQKLPPFIEKVGLFVNTDAQTINTLAQKAGVTLIQLHFEADEKLKSALKLPFIEVIRARDAEDIRQLDPLKYYLIDAYCESYGGSGKRLNLEWFDGLDCSRFILAGGLTPENVSETCPYNFFGVDVSSGTEEAKGKKDPKKVSSFIRNAKTC